MNKAIVNMYVRLVKAGRPLESVPEEYREAVAKIINPEPENESGENESDAE